MNMKKLIIILAIVLPTFVICTTSCGPNRTDLEWESVLKGYWKPLNEETGELCVSIPYFHFGDSANGSSKYYKYDYTDTMKWEVRRKQLNIYYEKAVEGYYIGYNQYNSRALIHVRSVSENEVLMSQLYNSGVQSDYKLVRITPEEYYSVYTGGEDTTQNSGSHNIDNTF